MSEPAEHTQECCARSNPENLREEGNLRTSLQTMVFLSHLCPNANNGPVLVACTNFMTFGSRPYSHLLFIYSSLFISVIATLQFYRENDIHYKSIIRAPVRPDQGWISEQKPSYSWIWVCGHLPASVAKVLPFFFSFLLFRQRAML